MKDKNIGPLRLFLASLPGWFVFFKVLELALLRSQEPEWFALWSTKKLLTILAGFTLSIVWLKWIGPRIAVFSFWNDVGKLARHLRPVPTFLCLALLARLCSLGLPAGAGEDVAPQALSGLQWLHGQSPAPNFVTTPEASDLSRDSSRWMLRPPAAAYLALPGLLCGLSLGVSLHLALFALCVTGGIGWLLLGIRFGLARNLLLLAAILLAGPAGTATLSMATASCITAALFPWALLWVGRLGKRLTDSGQTFRGTFPEVGGFHLLLGCLAWVKLSSLLTIAAVAAALPTYCLLRRSERGRTGPLLLVFAMSGILFAAPHLGLNRINREYSNLDANDLYSKQNYDAQSDLWGEHFSASTRGPMLALSLAAGPGYALPTKNLLHGIRDLLRQFEGVRSFLHSARLNPHAFLSGLAALGLSACLLQLLKNLPESCSTYERVVFITLTTVPFLGLALASFMHGYNYVLYHAYTGEFAFVFTLLCLRFLSQPTQTIRVPRAVLLPLCLALPFQLAAEQSIMSVFSHRTDGMISTTERERSLGPTRFSSAIQLAEKDSNSSLDALFFLPAGDMADLRLRTSLRSFAIHFSGNNLPAYGPFKSSKPLRVYCLVDSSLAKDGRFITTLKSKFPPSSTWSELPIQSSKNSPALLRVELAASS